MSFFDDKQEVLKIELTPYGKNLFAKGKFKPVYYSFHDDEILYDLQFANRSELQHSASSRIMDETVYLKPQARFTSVENTVKNIIPVDETSDNNLYLSTLGNSSLNSDYKPAWNLQMLKSSIKNSENLYTGSTAQNLPIPQINLQDIYFALNVKASDEDKGALDFKFLDNTALSIDQEYILMQIEESNTDQHESNKNFEIEIFEVQNSGSREILDRINFPAQDISVVNDILLDEPKVLLSASERERQKIILTDNYFNIAIDEEINLDALLGPEAERLSPEREEKTKPPFGEDC